MAQVYDVFISYARKDYLDDNQNVIPGNVISTIKETLTKEGISFWFDEEGIYSGQNFIEKIVNNIESSKLFLYLSTANANNSRWTCKEIASANEFGKPIIPVRIDKSPYNKKVMFLISDLDYIEYYNNPEIGLRDVVTSIKTHLQALKEEEEKRRLEEQRKREEELSRQEEERRRKKDEERRREEEQQRIVTDLEVACTKLNVEEKKIDLDRSTLLLDAERIADTQRKEQMKSLITSSSPIRQKMAEEFQKLQARITSLEAEAATTRAEKQRLESELEQALNSSPNKELVSKLKKELDKATKDLKKSEQEREHLSEQLKDLRKRLEGTPSAPVSTKSSLWNLWPWLIGLLMMLTTTYWSLLFGDEGYHLNKWAFFMISAFCAEVLMLALIALRARSVSRKRSEITFKDAFRQGINSQWTFHALFLLLTVVVSWICTFLLIYDYDFYLPYDFKSVLFAPVYEELLFRFLPFLIASLPLVYLGKKPWMKVLKVVLVLLCGFFIIIIQSIYILDEPYRRGEIYALLYAIVLYIAYQLGLQKWEGRKTKALFYAHAMAYLSSFAVNLLYSFAMITTIIRYNLN